MNIPGRDKNDMDRQERRTLWMIVGAFLLVMFWWGACITLIILCVRALLKYLES